MIFSRPVKRAPRGWRAWWPHPGANPGGHLHTRHMATIFSITATSTLAGHGKPAPFVDLLVNFSIHSG